MTGDQIAALRVEAIRCQRSGRPYMPDPAQTITLCNLIDEQRLLQVQLVQEARELRQCLEAITGTTANQMTYLRQHEVSHEAPADGIWQVEALRDLIVAVARTGLLVTLPF